MGIEMVKITVKPQGGCLLWHRWSLVKAIGSVEYFACRDCSARHARQPKRAPDDIQYDWVMGSTDNLLPSVQPRNPPPKRP
jgi:hypothetical protein